MGLHELEAPMLIDPICGASVNVLSQHRSVRGGAMFYFCSEVCRARFLAGPLLVVVINAPDAPITGPMQTVADALDEVAEEAQGLLENVGKSASTPGQEDEPAQVGWFRGLINSWTRTKHERRHAKRTSRELLALYRNVAADHPELSDREHYKLVVMARNGCDSTAAKLVLDCAEESFAQWPVMRELTLCDVVRYLSVSEFFAAYGCEHWMRSNTNINLIVKSSIPHDLCVTNRNK